MVDVTFLQFRFRVTFNFYKPKVTINKVLRKKMTGNYFFCVEVHFLWNEPWNLWATFLNNKAENKFSKFQESIQIWELFCFEKKTNFFCLKKMHHICFRSRLIIQIDKLQYILKQNKKNGFLVKNCNPKYWKLITCLNFCNWAPYEKVTLEMWGSLV